jgi:nucleotide-binding universal stress UspA family protein
MAFKKILVPLDGSTLAELALAPAVELARGEASVMLLRAVATHTFPGVDPTDRQVHVVDDAEAYLARVAAELRRRGVNDVQTSVWYGPAVSAIVDAAATRGVDLIVMSTHGRGGIGRTVMGSVAEAVLRSGTRPVALVRAQDAPVDDKARPPASRPGYRRALVPLDGSRFAESVLPLVRDIAGPVDIELVLLRVVEPQPMPVFDEAQRTLTRELVTRREDAEEYLAPVAADLRNRGVRVDALVCRGEAAKEILRVAREREADLIIMSTHGRTGLRRLVVGSVAEAVARDSSVPVLLMPAGEDAPSERGAAQRSDDARPARPSS